MYRSKADDVVHRCLSGEHLVTKICNGESIRRLKILLSLPEMQSILSGTSKKSNTSCAAAARQVACVPNGLAQGSPEPSVEIMHVAQSEFCKSIRPPVPYHIIGCFRLFRKGQRPRRNVRRESASGLRRHSQNRWERTARRNLSPAGMPCGNNFIRICPACCKEIIHQTALAPSPHSNRSPVTLRKGFYHNAADCISVIGGKLLFIKFHNGISSAADNLFLCWRAMTIRKLISFR